MRANGPGRSIVGDKGPLCLPVLSRGERTPQGARRGRGEREPRLVSRTIQPDPAAAERPETPAIRLPVIRLDSRLAARPKATPRGLGPARERSARRAFLSTAATPILDRLARTRPRPRSNIKKARLTGTPPPDPRSQRLRGPCSRRHAARRPAVRGPRPRRPPPRRAASASVDDRVALLAHELRDVVHRQPGLAGRAAPLPATERLDARPRAGRRAGAAVDVQDAGLDAVEELLDLGLVLAVDAGRQPVDRVVGERDRLVERIDGRDRGERREQLVTEQPVDAGRPPTTVGST